MSKLSRSVRNPPRVAASAPPPLGSKAELIEHVRGLGYCWRAESNLAGHKGALMKSAMLQGKQKAAFQIAADIRDRLAEPENQATISAWAESVGIDAPAPRLVDRAAEEMREARDAIRFENGTRAVEEMADVAICLYVAAERLGASLQAAIDRKMKLNRARKWRQDGTGCVYHVKEPELRRVPEPTEPKQPAPDLCEHGDTYGCPLCLGQ